MSSPMSLELAFDLGLSELAKRSNLLANIVEYVTFGSTPPETNVALILNGPGMAPMLQTAGAYASMAAALGTAADNSDGSTAVLSGAWQGPTSIPPQERFRIYSGWLREQASIAAQTASAAWNAAGAYQAAHASMIEIAAELVVNHVTKAVLMTTNMGQNAIPLALNEIHYGALWMRAAATMMTYAGATSAALQSMPSPQPAPSIADSGSAAATLPTLLADLTRSVDTTTTVGNPFGGPIVHKVVPTPPPPTPQPPPPTPQPPPPTPVSPSPPPTPVSGSDPLFSSPSVGLPDPGAGAEPQVASDQQPSSAAGADGFGNADQAQQGFFGTSPYSPTLAGLNGGGGSLVAFGVARGGLAAVSGAANGFRMPTTWARRSGGIFGVADEPEPSPTPVARGAQGGVSAPDTLRRRRNSDEKRPSKVIDPGAQEEIPELDSPPVIGVIEYAEPGDETSLVNI
ncbi:PPE family protein [Nocardia sp. CDC160]|uniref:PPE family protein n=1 Tax=Nocardia sp. CDC160 TaxID=3112166 RepID=UPI002DBB3C89|nr:PPE domain-containing protein [Nocardia sp. CDC160]MEC3920214.1 PPE domain-containing protein [Nocardia sp. CDC160]